MNVLVYISRGVSDVDKQYLTALFGLLDTDLNITVTQEVPSWQHDFSLFHIIGCWDAKHYTCIVWQYGHIRQWSYHPLATSIRGV